MFGIYEDGEFTGLTFGDREVANLIADDMRQEAPSAYIEVRHM